MKKQIPQRIVPHRHRASDRRHRPNLATACVVVCRRVFLSWPASFYIENRIERTETAACPTPGMGRSFPTWSRRRRIANSAARGYKTSRRGWPSAAHLRDLLQRGRLSSCKFTTSSPRGGARVPAVVAVELTYPRLRRLLSASGGPCRPVARHRSSNWTDNSSGPNSIPA